MSQKTNYAQTGVFVAIGIILFGMIFYFLSSDENIFAGRSRVHSYFEDTQGLMFGSMVSFSGITIGNVKAIEYDEEKKMLRVDYTIKKSYMPYIKTDSTAQLKTQGALGDRFVFISGGSMEAKPVEPGDEIKAEPSADIFDTVKNKIDSIPKLSNTFEKLESFIDFLNSEEGLKGSTRELKLTLIEARKTLSSVNDGNHTKKSLKKLDSILTKIDNGQGSLGKLISDPTLYNKITGFLGGSESTSSYLKSLGRKSIEKNED